MICGVSPARGAPGSHYSYNHNMSLSSTLCICEECVFISSPSYTKKEEEVFIIIVILQRTRPMLFLKKTRQWCLLRMPEQEETDEITQFVV